METSFFWETEYTMPPDAPGFSHFCPGHLIWLGAALALCAALWVLYSEWDEGKKRLCLRTLAVLLVCDELFKYGIAIHSGEFRPSFLPLHLCSIGAVRCLPARGFFRSVVPGLELPAPLERPLHTQLHGPYPPAFVPAAADIRRLPARYPSVCRDHSGGAGGSGAGILLQPGLRHQLYVSLKGGGWQSLKLVREPSGQPGVSYGHTCDSGDMLGAAVWCSGPEKKSLTEASGCAIM